MTNIFDSYDLGGAELPNRIVMAPLTRSRAASDKSLRAKDKTTVSQL
jgi:2,4-dienoyl-CoA reductase-like NADH-dependent reductase (Old Yellow Enzyme family)